MGLTSFRSQESINLSLKRMYHVCVCRLVPCADFIIDTTCLIWNTSCSDQGACALYNAKNMRLRYYGVYLASRIAALLFVIFAYRKARTKYNWSVEEHNHCPGVETNDVMLQRTEDNDNLRWEQNESSF